MEGEDQNSNNITKILDLVRSQQNGLEINRDNATDTINYRDLAQGVEGGEDTRTLSNFFNLLSKALPIEQMSIMLHQELENRKKALSNYQVKCNEAEYLLPKLVVQEEALNSKLKLLNDDLAVHRERLDEVKSKLNGYTVEQSDVDKQIEHSRNNIMQLKKKLASCDKLQDCIQKLCNDSKPQVMQTPMLDTSSTQPIESSGDTQLTESSLTTDNNSVISSVSPAKSHNSELIQIPSTEHSLSDGEIVDDSECGSLSDSNSDIDDTDEI